MTVQTDRIEQLVQDAGRRALPFRFRFGAAANDRNPSTSAFSSSEVRSDRAWRGQNSMQCPQYIDERCGIDTGRPSPSSPYAIQSADD